MRKISSKIFYLAASLGLSLFLSFHLMTHWDSIDLNKNQVFYYTLISFITVFSYVLLLYIYDLVTILFFESTQLNSKTITHMTLVHFILINIGLSSLNHDYLWTINLGYLVFLIFIYFGLSSFKDIIKIIFSYLDDILIHQTRRIISSASKKVIKIFFILSGIFWAFYLPYMLFMFSARKPNVIEMTIDGIAFACLCFGVLLQLKSSLRSQHSKNNL